MATVAGEKALFTTLTFVMAALADGPKPPARTAGPNRVDWKTLRKGLICRSSQVGRCLWRVLVPQKCIVSSDNLNRARSSKFKVPSRNQMILTTDKHLSRQDGTDFLQVDTGDGAETRKAAEQEVTGNGEKDEWV